MGARNRVRIGLSYLPARLHRLEELMSWDRFLVTLKGLQIRALVRGDKDQRSGMVYKNSYPARILGFESWDWINTNTVCHLETLELTVAHSWASQAIRHAFPSLTPFQRQLNQNGYLLALSVTLSSCFMEVEAIFTFETFLLNSNDKG